jgi:hypothetical protein
MLPDRNVKPPIVTLLERSICKQEVCCEVYWFVHEQADDQDDTVLLYSYTKKNLRLHTSHLLLLVAERHHHRDTGRFSATMTAFCRFLCAP